MIKGNSLGPTRRSLLRQSLLCGSAWMCAFTDLRLSGSIHRNPDPRGHGSMLGLVPFSGEGHPPMGEVLGSELDGRLFTDLSALTPENPVTPTDQVFIRTRASKLLDTSSPWVIHVAGLIEKPIAISAEALARNARPMGSHLVACSVRTRRA